MRMRFGQGKMALELPVLLHLPQPAKFEGVLGPHGVFAADRYIQYLPDGILHVPLMHWEPARQALLAAQVKSSWVSAAQSPLVGMPNRSIEPDSPLQAPTLPGAQRVAGSPPLGASPRGCPGAAVPSWTLN